MLPLEIKQSIHSIDSEFKNLHAVSVMYIMRDGVIMVGKPHKNTKILEPMFKLEKKTSTILQDTFCREQQNFSIRLKDVQASKGYTGEGGHKNAREIYKNVVHFEKEFSCCFTRAQVRKFGQNGEILGFITQNKSVFPKFKIIARQTRRRSLVQELTEKLAADLTIEGPQNLTNLCQFYWSLPCGKSTKRQSTKFLIFDSSRRVVGQIMDHLPEYGIYCKNFSPNTPELEKLPRFTISLDPQIESRCKILVINACFLIDFLYFSHLFQEIE